MKPGLVLVHMKPEALDLVIEHLLHDFLQFLDIHET